MGWGWGGQCIATKRFHVTLNVSLVNMNSFKSSYGGVRI